MPIYKQYRTRTINHSSKFVIYGSSIDKIVEPKLKEGVSLYEFAQDMNMEIITPNHTGEMGSRVIGFEVSYPLPSYAQLKGLRRLFQETFQTQPKLLLIDGEL